MDKYHQLLTGSISCVLNIWVKLGFKYLCFCFNKIIYSVSFILEPLGPKSLGQNIAKVMSSLLGYVMPLRFLEK